MSGSISFAINRPSTASSASSSARPRSNGKPTFRHGHVDSTDESGPEEETELVTGFDTTSGFERCVFLHSGLYLCRSGSKLTVVTLCICPRRSKHPSKKVDRDRPPVIPSLPNRNFREAAIARRTRKMYNPADERPKSTVALVEAKDVIGDSQVAGGISVKERRTTEVEVEVQTPEGGADPAPTGASTPLEALTVESPVPAPAEPETEDQRALRELLGGDRAAQNKVDDVVIPVDGEWERQRLEEEEAGEPSEAEALKRDIQSRPDEVRLSSTVARLLDRLTAEPFAEHAR
jgi:hypothetical protein